MKPLLLAAACALAAPAAQAAVLPRMLGHTRVVEIHYRAHDGRARAAYVELPRWYSGRDDPPIPLVIAPHGRGIDALVNLRYWGDLPGRDGFALVCPDGQGRRLELYSWGDPGQIADLARMPDVVGDALPWVHVDRRRVYAFGGSMGGQEALLLVARYPRLLAGAAAFDAPTNLALRYRDFVRLHGGEQLQDLALAEVGAPPAADRRAWEVRSPLDFVRRIAFSGVPLQVWWSTRDRIVVDQRRQSGLLCRTVRRLNPDAPLTEVVGAWKHTAEMRWNTRLPEALALSGLGPS